MSASGLLIVWAIALIAFDWRRRRLPNWLLACAWIVGAIHAALHGAMPYGATVVEGLATAVVALLVFWPAYRAGWMGAGDVKLCATLGWLGGAKMLIAVLLIGGVASGLIALAMLMPRLSDHLAGPEVAPGLKRRLPYGAALGLGFIAWTSFGPRTGLALFG